MSVEFVDANVLVYAHDGGAGAKHEKSVSCWPACSKTEPGP
jgi:hypothetical protein